MMARSFVVKSDPVGCGWPVWFRLYVYTTADELQRAAKRYSSFREMEWDGCYGCFHPSLALYVDRNGKVKRTPRTKYLGVMRLTTEQCSPGVVIHECTHAAINYVNALRLVNGYMVGRSNIHSEEAICYATQHFSNAVLYIMGYVDHIAQDQFEGDTV